MPLRQIVAAICAALACGYAGSPLKAGEPFPYTVHVTAREAYLRSGPGDTYYPVLKLRRNQVLEVYRHDPGSWYAVRPTEDCFSWVSAQFARPEGNRAEIAGDRVASRIGSALSDIRDVIQVRLDHGEQVRLIEAGRFKLQNRFWYKIAPPAGEFRWVAAKDVARGSATTDDSEDPNGDENIPHDNDSQSHLVDADDTQTTNDETTDDAKTDDGDPELKPKDATGKVDLKAETEEIDLELSAMVSEEPSVWQFSELGARAEAALARSTTGLERGRARRVLRKIEHFSQIRERYDAVAELRARTDRRDKQLNAAETAFINEKAGSDHHERFDGVGRLTQVISRRAGDPQYALLDDHGQVVYYVSPAPGVNLRRYLNQEVGLNGTLGYLPEQRAQHVTAKRVTSFDGSIVR